jgi:hypothetical protein
MIDMSKEFVGELREKHPGRVADSSGEFLPDLYLFERILELHGRGIIGTAEARAMLGLAPWEEK